MDYTIYPYEGVGPIRFGMTPEQVREKLGEPEDTFMKGAESPFPADAYHNLGFHVHYDKSGRCEFVKFFYGSSANPMFQGQTLFGRLFGELKSWLQSLETDVRYYDCGLVFLKFGISLYSEEYCLPHQDPDFLIEAVGVFASGYSDEIGLGNPREESIDVCFEEYDLCSVLVEGAEFMDYIIYPYEGVGPIRFGMTPEQVHEKLGEPERTTMKEAESPEFPTDAYDDLGIYVYYGKSGRCEGVDFFEDGSASPTFQGQALIGRPFGELKSWLQSLKTDVQHYDCGLIFLKFGINLYSQYYYLPHRDPGCLVEVVGVSTSSEIEGRGIGYPREEVIP
jgi:hypothetical protein